jgi:hypothetical protein
MHSSLHQLSSVPLDFVCMPYGENITACLTARLTALETANQLPDKGVNGSSF